ncbi:cytosine permease [Mycolicibacterium madagascariense]|uniref:Cytosine permease n=1 Tax=Mycolicibacterium madagascariense TaxID=212765 RepID=A0A7I7XI39_9MYCO|nr:cytosine permease [Mycolicibacterium madagascariense]MCV7015785.1 cytosine permease [Mycolicibacterium madagascariense]BBZ28850.1 cytosine permease [Mycolicibacterium madagascariense]
MSTGVSRPRPFGHGPFSHGVASDEVPPTLVEPAPRVLGVLDQLGLWGNLGVSLLGFTGAAVVLQPFGPGTPHLSLLAALLATVLGTCLGTAAVAMSAIPGTQTGAPAMVLLRGLLGSRVSYLPTVLNVAQMIGWGTFELVTISTAANTVLPSVPQWIWVVVGGVITTLLSLYPLGAIRVLRRYVTVAVLIAMVYLFVELLSHPLPSVTEGSWSGFSIAVDTTVAVAVSWVPMAADYARHSRSSAAAFTGAFFGYGFAQIACYALGLLALVTVAADGDHIFAAFIAVPLGGLAFAVLAVREIDQSFANVYSTTVSTQNLRPRWDRRLISLVVGVVITVLALAVDIYGYASFLSLIGSVFVPLFAVLVVDYFCFSGRREWDLTPSSPSRWLMLLPWAFGFITYQLIYPGQVQWWAAAWGRLAELIGFTAQPWMSASIFSFVVAAVLTGLISGARRLAARERV